jgi:hypothetical protein
VTAPDADTAAQADSDARQAWTYAANCRLYEDDPGPAHLNIGSAHEPRMVTRAAAWRDAYAHYLLVDLEADHARLTAATEVCRRNLRRTWTPSFWAEVARSQASGSGTRRHGCAAVARALSPREMFLLRKVHKVAVELCELAAGLVQDAGAATDEKARCRLLAGSRHTGMLIALGSIPGVAEDSQQTYLDEIRRIDED